PDLTSRIARFGCYTPDHASDDSRQPKICSLSTAQRTHENRANFASALGRDRTEDAAVLRRKVHQRVAVLLKDVMIEHDAPGIPLRGRQIAQREYRMQERVERRVAVHARRVPPIIDQHVETLERLDVMPPEIRDVERITRDRKSVA